MPAFGFCLTLMVNKERTPRMHVILTHVDVIKFKVLFIIVK